MNKLRILYVEDRDAWQHVVQLALVEHEVLCFSHVEEARARYEVGDIDLVICDGSVDETGDGLRWAHELYAASRPVFVFSGGDFGRLPGLSKDEMREGEALVLMVEKMAPR